MRRPGPLVGFLSLLSFLLVHLVLGPPVAFGQSGTGGIAGRVVDDSGGVLPGAMVTVANTETGVAREVVTNEQGLFSVPNLPAGVYEVTAELPGFQAIKTPGLVLNVGQALDVQIKLPLAGLAQELVVLAEAPVVNTSQTRSSVIASDTIRDLPLSGRRWEDLALLTPGVVRQGSTIAVGGLGPQGMSSFNIDGFDFNSSMFGRSRGGNRPPFQMSQDAIREFQILTNSYSAEFGRVGGGILNAVTMTGTNTLRGSGFYYLRDAAFGAINAFATEKPDDRRQQFGATVGGPIVQNKLFYFLNTDNQRHSNPFTARSGSALSNVANVTQADVTAAYNRFRTDPAFDPTLTPEQAWQNFVEIKAFVERGVGLQPRRYDQVTLFPRIDWAARPNMNLSVRYNYQKFEATNGLLGGNVIHRAPENAGTSIVETHTVGTQLNVVAGSSTVFETRVSYAFDDQPDTFVTQANSAIRNIPSEVNITDGTTYTFGALNYLPRIIKERRSQIIQNMTHLRGTHSIKVGMDINIVDQDNIQTRTVRGLYNFTNLVNYAVGAYRTFTQNLGDPAAPQVATDWAGYIQDDWKLRPNLTLNLGLRYDLQTFTQPTVPNPRVPETQRIPVDKNNFGPRLGFSWYPGDEPRTVFRGGYGLAFVRTLTVDTEIFLFRNGTTRQLVNFTGPDNAAGSVRGAPVFPGILDNRLTLDDLGLPVNLVEVGFAAPGRQNGEVQHANFTVERRLTPSMSASVGWIFVKGNRLTGKIHENVGATPVRFRDVAIVDVNNRQIGTVRDVPDYNAINTRPNPTLGDFFVNRSEFSSRYNALALTLNKRLSNNYQFTMAYTLSKAEDNNPQQQGADISVPLGQKARYWGPADTDQRHRFVFSGGFHQPRWEATSPVVRGLFNGWRVSAIVALESAFPRTHATSVNLTRIRSGVELAPLGDGPYATYGRNATRGYGNVQNDLRVTRSFTLPRGAELELMAEVFNLVNRTNLTGFNSTLYTYSANATYINQAGQSVRGDRLMENPNFGAATGAGNAREVQFAVRVRF